MVFTYFNRFPIVNYTNINTRDLSRHVVLGEHLRRIPTVFHPFELNNDIRADQLAYMYYKDPDVDWLINITNGIVDPYYGWYMDITEFDNFLIDKYGSIEEPQIRIFFWQTNWASDDWSLSIAAYNALPAERQKYWIPIFGQQNQILAYTRRREDWHMNTNQILSLTIDDTSSFKQYDLVTAFTGGQYVGRAEVDSVVSNTVLYIYNVQDNWNVGSEVRHRNLDVQTLGSSDPTGHVITATNTIYQNITIDEGSYWEPVYYFDYERMINESKKIVLLLDANYMNDAVIAFNNLISNN